MRESYQVDDLIKCCQIYFDKGTEDLLHRRTDEGGKLTKRKTNQRRLGTGRRDGCDRPKAPLGVVHFLPKDTDDHDKHKHKNNRSAEERCGRAGKAKMAEVRGQSRSIQQPSR